MTHYINTRTNYGVETVDEFETRKEARKMLDEYSMAFTTPVYVSTRCTKEWKES